MELPEYIFCGDVNARGGWELGIYGVSTVLVTYTLYLLCNFVWSVTSLLSFCGFISTFQLHHLVLLIVEYSGGKTLNQLLQQWHLLLLNSLSTLT